MNQEVKMAAAVKEVKQEKKAKNPADRLPVGKFFLWKSRDVSLAAMNTIILGYLMIFCTNALGLNAGTVGVLLLVSKIFDGVTDLFAGYIVDNTHTRLGKARPYEFCILGVWLTTLLLFFCPAGWGEFAKSAWVFAMYTLDFSIFSTMLNANQTPYMIRAFSNNKIVITKVSSFGGIVSMIFAMVVSVSFPILMKHLATDAGGWRSLILIYAVPFALIGILRLIFVKEDPSIDAAAGQSTKINAKEVLTMLKKNKYCWISAAIMLFYQLAVGFGAGSYYFTYIIGDISKFGLVSVLSVVTLPLMIFFPAMIRKMSVAKLFAIFGTIAFLGYMMVFVGGSNVTIVYIGVILTVLLNLPLGYLGALVIMQLATYNEYMGLHRMEASSSAISNFASKVGGGIGTGLTGILLSAAGFISSTTGTVAQPDSALHMIRMLYSVLPALCAALIVFFSILLGRLGKRIPEMEADIKNRENASEAAAQMAENTSGEGSVEAMAAEEAKAEIEKSAGAEKENK